MTTPSAQSGSRTDFDLIIVGGGLVGASLACALSGHGLRLCLVERFELSAAPEASYDDRSLALSLASCQILRRLSLWPLLDGQHTAIQQVHVTSRHQPGLTRIRAAELGIDALGHVVAGRILGSAMLKRLPELEDLTLICPAEVTAIRQAEDQIVLTLDGGGEPRQISARLMAAADGADSPCRSMLGLSARTHDYQQTAVIANLTPDQDHRGRAFERFSAQGPMALLPHVGKRCGLVWTRSSDQAQALLDMDDESFRQSVQREFGYRLGAITRVGARASYPLRLVHARRQWAGRGLILGNAAHAIHPISAQGFNLGLRDVATLAEMLISQHASGQDLGSAVLLADYQQARQPDQDAIIEYTHTLVTLFAQPFAPIQLGRSLALMATELITPLKHVLARRTLGYAGQVSALARLNDGVFADVD